MQMAGSSWRSITELQACRLTRQHYSHVRCNIKRFNLDAPLMRFDGPARVFFFFSPASSLWVLLCKRPRHNGGVVALLLMPPECGSGGLKSALKGLSDQRTVSSVSSAAVSNARDVLWQRSDVRRETAPSLMTPLLKTRENKPRIRALTAPGRITVNPQQAKSPFHARMINSLCETLRN